MWRTNITVDQIDNGLTLKILVASKEYTDIKREIEEFQATPSEVLTRIQEFVPTAIQEINAEVAERQANQPTQ